MPESPKAVQLDTSEVQPKLVVLASVAGPMLSYEWPSATLVDSFSFSKLSSLSKGRPHFELWIDGFLKLNQKTVLMLLSGDAANGAQAGEVLWDDTFCKVDLKLKRVEFFSLDSFPGYTRQNLSLDLNRALFPYLHGIRQSLDAKRKRWVIPLARALNTVPGDSLFESIRMPSIGYLDYTQLKSAFHTLPVTPPPVRTGYYPDFFSDPDVLVDHQFNYLVSYPYSSYVIRFNPDNQSAVEVQFNSELYPDVPTSSLQPSRAPGLAYSVEYPSDDPSLPYYYPITFDPYRLLYYRLVRIPLADYDPLCKGQFAYSIVIADTGFQLAGEALLPDEIIPHRMRFALFPAPDGLYCWNPTRTSAYANSYVFTRLDFRPTRKPAAKVLRRQLEARAAASRPGGRGLADYLRQKHKLNLDNEGILIVPVDNSCPSCRDFVLRYFADSLLPRGAAAPRLLLLAANPTEIERVVDAYGLRSWRERILTDPSRQVLRYVPEWINPRWLVVRQGELVHDAVLNPTEIYTLPNRVRRWQAGE